MDWHECSLICSDACGCAAWHVAPTPRTAMPVAMQARSARRAFKERLTPSLLPPGSQSPARTDDISNKTHRTNRKRNLPLSESDRGRITLSIFLPCRRVDSRSRGGRPSRPALYFSCITRITRPITPYFSHITRITRFKKNILK